MKSKFFKKVISSILVLSAICSFGAVSCFAMEPAPNEDSEVPQSEWDLDDWLKKEVPYDVFLANAPIDWLFWDEVWLLLNIGHKFVQL